MWRVIEEFPDYVINEYGTIYKIHGRSKNIVMQPKLDKDGYLNIGLRNDKGRFHRRVHQLVAKSFINNPKNYEVVNHIDGNKTNNHFTNLEWCTVAYNTRYSYEKGMVCTYDFELFAKEVARNYIVEDVWGEKHDIRNIDIVNLN